MKTIFFIDDLYHTTRAEPMLIEPLSATTNKNTYKVEVEYKMKLYRQSRQQQLNQLLWFILSFKTQRRQRFFCVFVLKIMWTEWLKLLLLVIIIPCAFSNFVLAILLLPDDEGRRSREVIPSLPCEYSEHENMCLEIFTQTWVSGEWFMSSNLLAWKLRTLCFCDMHSPFMYQSQI